MEIIHDGLEAGRVDKIKKVIEYKAALSNLRVCWNDMNTNCGKCIKCLRTMIPLKLLGATTSPFPPFPPLKVIRRINSKNEHLFYLKENINLSEQVGDIKLHNAMLTGIRRYEKIYLLKEIDRIFLGGIIKRIYRKIFKLYSSVPLISITPDE